MAANTPSEHLELFVALARRALLLVARALHVLRTVGAMRRIRPVVSRLRPCSSFLQSLCQFFHPFRERAEVSHKGLPLPTLRPHGPADEPRELLGVHCFSPSDCARKRQNTCHDAACFAEIARTTPPSAHKGSCAWWGGGPHTGSARAASGARARRCAAGSAARRQMAAGTAAPQRAAGVSLCPTYSPRPARSPSPAARAARRGHAAGGNRSARRSAAWAAAASPSPSAGSLSWCQRQTAAASVCRKQHRTC
eukprot:7387364-Prymnesium_polylepis.1